MQSLLFLVVFHFRGLHIIITCVFIRAKAAITIEGRPRAPLSGTRAFLAYELQVSCSESPRRVVRWSRDVPARKIPGVSPSMQRRLAPGL
jgi:hypothetical protein